MRYNMHLISFYEGEWNRNDNFNRKNEQQKYPIYGMNRQTDRIK